MPSPIITVSNVQKSYGPTSQQVLRGVSIDIEEGQFIGLVGSSGSGKTTLLNLIGGLDVPDEGEINVCSEPIFQMNEARRSNFRLHNIGFVFQFFNLLPNLSVLENIEIPLYFQNMKEKEARERALEYADEVGLKGKTDRIVHQLSGGELQRVGLARALAHRPKVLLADEPTGNLDSVTGVKILDLIKETTKRHNTTVLMATHDPKAASVCDQMVRMKDGQIVAEGEAG